jgi:hypothetical protein
LHTNVRSTANVVPPTLTVPLSGAANNPQSTGWQPATALHTPSLPQVEGTAPAPPTAPVAVYPVWHAQLATVLDTFSDSPPGRVSVGAPLVNAGAEGSVAHNRRTHVGSPPVQVPSTPQTRLVDTCPDVFGATTKPGAQVNCTWAPTERPLGPTVLVTDSVALGMSNEGHSRSVQTRGLPCQVHSPMVPVPPGSEHCWVSEPPV